MTAKVTAQLLADLGITKSHSRPHVSNDNPYSESQFKTLKYRPSFPDSFGSIQDSRGFLRSFFAWYNTEHRHSGIAMMTPQSVHLGLAKEIWEQRRRVLEESFRNHPERFVHGTPKPPALPTAAWINEPKTTEETPAAADETTKILDQSPINGAQVAILGSLSDHSTNEGHLNHAQQTEASKNIEGEQSYAIAT